MTVETDTINDAA